jgi:probable O-glycosylation ligase (exosortase A-associated)
MRDLMMAMAMGAAIPMALLNGFVAYLLWGWTAVLSPAFYLYGFMQSFRFNFVFAIISIGMLILGRVQQKGTFQWNRTTVLLVLFLLHASLSTLFAYRPNPILGDVMSDFAKSMVFCLLMPFFVTSRYRIHAMLIMVAFGLGLHGVVEGGKVLTSGGGHNVQGIPASKLSDNNHFAVGMAMALPILLYLYQYSQKKWVSLAFLGALLLTVMSILGTNSRGGFLAMAVVGIWVVLTSRRKFLSLVVVAVCAVAVLYFAPDTWFSRIDSINDAGQDSSFLGRLFAWQVSSAIALQNPIFGGGMRAQQIGWIYEMFKDAPALFDLTSGFVVGYAVAAHSIYFQVLGEQGFVGLALFLAILGNALITRVEIKNLAKKLGDDFLWARDLADLLAVSVVAFAVGGAGVSLAHFETLYVVVMLQELLKQQLTKQALVQQQDLKAVLEK